MSHPHLAREIDAVVQDVARFIKLFSPNTKLERDHYTHKNESVYNTPVCPNAHTKTALGCMLGQIGMLYIIFRVYNNSCILCATCIVYHSALLTFISKLIKQSTSYLKAQLDWL